MGVRIIKAIGYGLDDLSVDKAHGISTDDPRINHDSPVFDGDSEGLLDDASYLDHLTAKTEMLHNEESFEHPDFELVFSKFMVEESNKGEKPLGSDVFQGIIYDGEYGDPKTLLIVPPGMSYSWFRYDDAIDRIESDLASESQSMPSTKRIPFPPYPFAGWMDTRTGVKLTSEQENGVRQLQRLERVKTTQTFEKAESFGVVLDKMSEHAGFEDHESFTKNLAPLVPLGVRDLAEWAGIFTDDTTWRQLRPMLYTYWG